MIRTREFSHVGKFFKFTILDEMDITIKQAAINLGISRKTLSEFINGKTKCSTIMARRLSDATGTDVSFWINMQANRDIMIAKDMKINNKIIPFSQNYN